MKNLLSLAPVCACLLLFSPSASAQDEMAASGQSYLSLGVGAFDIFDNDGAADYRVEYTSGNTLFWKLQPFVGVEATSDGSVWGGGGVKADFMAAPNIYIDPSLGVGLYGQGSSDKDLGSAIEFRAQVEGGYEFTNGHRLGVALSHMSNAGIDDENPGSETLNLYYHIPVGDLF